MVMPTLHDCVSYCACALSYTHEDDVWRGRDMCIGNWLNATWVWEDFPGRRPVAWKRRAVAVAVLTANDVMAVALFKYCHTKRRLQTYAILWHFISGYETLNSVWNWVSFQRRVPAVSKARPQNRAKRVLSTLCLRSARMEPVGSHRTDFHQIWYLRIFRKYVEKIQVSWRSENNKGYFTRRPIHIYYNISFSSS